jgi:hypothetical protein
MHRHIQHFIFIFLFIGDVHAQVIKGDVSEINLSKPLGNVTIVNVHTDSNVITDSNGRFAMAAEKGHLIEFRKIGYKTVRIRVPAGTAPSYYKIILQKGPIELEQFDIAAKGHDYKKDSLSYYELYKNALEFPELTGLDAIQHPFSALSKKNQRIWAFQKEYASFEREKFIDYTFNEKVVKNLTGFQGDSVQIYLKKYRPSYDAIRSMNDYQFYKYVKESVENFREGRKYRPVIRRSAN